MAISDKVITFKKESRLKNTLIVAAVSLAVAVAIFMTVLYVTKVPTTTKITGIELLDSYNSLKAGEDNTYHIDLPPNSNYNLFYRTEPSASVLPSMNFTSNNVDVAYVRASDGTITLYTIKEGKSTAVIEITKKLKVTIVINVKPLKITSVKLNYEDFFTDSTLQSGIMNIGTSITLKPRFTAVLNSDTGRITEVSKNCQFEITPIDGGSDIVFASASPSQRVTDCSITAKKPGRFLVKITPQGITEDEKTAIGEIMIEIEIVNMPTKLTLNQAGRNKENIGRELLGNESFMMYASDSVDVIYNLADYINLISTHKDVPIYLSETQSKGLKYSLEENAHVSLDPETGMLTIYPVKDGRNISLFITAASKYRAITTYKFAAKIELPVTRIKAVGLTGDKGTGDSIDNPITLTHSDNEIMLEFNGDPDIKPTDSRFRLAVIASYALEQDNIDLPLTGDVEIVSISGGRIKASNLSTRINGKVRIGVFSMEHFPYLNAEDFDIDMTDIRFQCGFSEIWIRVQNEPELKSLTFESGNPDAVSKQIYLPAGQTTDLWNYLYPFPSNAHVEDKVSFSIKSGQAALNNAEISGMTANNPVIVEVKKTESGEKLCEFIIIPFTLFSETEFQWRDDGVGTSNLSAVYVKNNVGSGSKFLADSLFERLGLAAFLSQYDYNYIDFFVTSSNDNAQLTVLKDKDKKTITKALNISGYSKNIIFTAKVSNDEDYKGIADYFNYKNILSGKKNYYGPTEISVSVDVIYGASDVAVMNSPDVAADYNIKNAKLELESGGQNIIKLDEYYKLLFYELPAGVSADFEKAEISLVGDTEYADWDSGTNTLTVRRNNSGSDVSIYAHIRIHKCALGNADEGRLEIVVKREKIEPDGIEVILDGQKYTEESGTVSKKLQADVFENSFAIIYIKLTAEAGLPEQDFQIILSDPSVLKITDITDGYRLAALDTGVCTVVFASVKNNSIFFELSITVEFSGNVFLTKDEHVVLNIDGSGEAQHVFSPVVNAFNLTDWEINAEFLKDYGGNVKLLRDGDMFTLRLKDCLLTERIVITVTANYKDKQRFSRNINYSVSMTDIVLEGVNEGNDQANPLKLYSNEAFPLVYSFNPLSASYNKVSYFFSVEGIVYVDESGVLRAANEEKGGAVKMTVIPDNYRDKPIVVYILIEVRVLSMEAQSAAFKTENGFKVLEFGKLNYYEEITLVFNMGAGNTDFSYAFTKYINSSDYDGAVDAGNVKAGITLTDKGFKIRLTQKGEPILLTIKADGDEAITEYIIIRFVSGQP